MFKKKEKERENSTWTFTTRIGGTVPDEFVVGSSTNRAMWSIFLWHKKTSTPNG